jgi:DNA-binding PadR family transcriptional regulator
VVLALLERAPMHGYQILAEIEAIFGDAYEPSTGTIYPAVRALEEEGLVRSSEDGRRAIYALTAIGRKALAQRSENLAALEERTATRIRAGGELERLLLHAKEAATRVDADKALIVLARAVDELKSLQEQG